MLLGRDFYHECVNDGVNEEGLEMVRTWITTANTMLNPPPKALPAPPAGAMAPGAPPMAGPPMPGAPPPAPMPGPPMAAAA
jgi:hypothetical protein